MLLIRLFVWIAFITAGLVALHAGIVLRRQFWTTSAGQLRFPGDIRNTWSVGNDVLNQARRVHRADGDKSAVITWRQFFRGYLATYDAAIASHPDGNYEIDYPPLRLLAAGLWVRSAKLANPRTSQWSDPITLPLLDLNTAAEILGSLAAFFLVMRTVYRQRLSQARSFWTRSLLSRSLPPANSPVASNVEPPDMSDLWLQPTGVLPAVIALLSIGYYAYIAYQLGYWPDWIEESHFPGATDFLALLVLFIALVGSIQTMTIPYRAWFAAFLAGLLVWFNPAMLLNAHAWPQWDCWIVPAYLLAALFISLDWGFAAGMTIAIGCMIKGQLLVGAPVLIFWPLLAGRSRTALVAIVGFIVTFSLLVSPWLVPADGWKWAIGFAAIAAAAQTCVFIKTRFRISRQGTAGRLLQFALRHVGALISLVFVAAMCSRLLGNWHVAPPEANTTGVQQWIRLSLPLWWARVLIAVVIAAVPWFIRRRRSRAIALACIAATAVWLAYYRGPGGTDAWYEVGFKYGGNRYVTTVEPGTFNLAAILHEDHQLIPDSRVDLNLLAGTAPTTVFLRNFEFTIYAISLLIISIGAALNERRRDTRLLVALAAPWVVMFAVMPQMHERYLLYGAVIGCVGVAAGTGDALLCLLLTALATIQIMIESTDNGASMMLVQMRDYLTAADPGLGWMTLIAAGAYIVNSVTPRVGPWSPQPNVPLESQPTAPYIHAP